MSRRRLVRGFWIGAAALLCVAALVAIQSLLTGSFDDTDGNILATLGLAFLAGSTLVSGFALVERGPLPALGWTTVALSPICFIILAAGIWGDDFGDLPQTALTFLVAELVVTTNLLMLRDRRFRWLVIGTAAIVGLMTALFLVVIWGDADSGGLGEALGVLAILMGLGYFLTPVLQRLAGTAETAAPAETVVATVGGLELVAVSGDADGFDTVVRDERGRLRVRAGDRETVLPAGTLLALRRSS